MLTTTIGDALNNHYTLREAYGVYIVRDGSTVLYVGKTERSSIVMRFQRHLGEGLDQRISLLGELILKHQPRSNRWSLEVLTLADCNAFLEQHDQMRRRKLKTAEAALIKFHRPCLNKQGNPDPEPLPEKYR